MAKCEICEKTAIHGNKLSITRSHISKRAPRTWKPNLRTVKAEVDGEIKRIHVCAKCLKNGKVKKKFTNFGSVKRYPQKIVQFVKIVRKTLAGSGNL